MPNYIVRYGFELQPGFEGPSGEKYGQGEANVTTDHEIITSDDYREVSKTVFRMIEGCLRVNIEAIAEVPDEVREIDPNDFDGDVVAGEVIDDGKP